MEQGIPTWPKTSGVGGKESMRTAVSKDGRQLPFRFSGEESVSPEVQARRSYVHL